LPLTLFFEDSKGRVERVNHQKMNYQILKKMNRVTERTRVPFFHRKKGRQQVMLRDLQPAP